MTAAAFTGRRRRRLSRTLLLWSRHPVARAVGLPLAIIGAFVLGYWGFGYGGDMAGLAVLSPDRLAHMMGMVP
jgi:hypothetical protein